MSALPVQSLKPPAQRDRLYRRLLVYLGLLLLGQGTLCAQNVILTPERDPVQTATQRKQNTPPPPSRPPGPPESPYRVGPIILHPRLTYTYLNADGMPTRTGARVSNEIHTLAAGFSADLGANWVLDYGPTWTKNSAGELADTVDHSASLVGMLSLGGFGMQFSQSYSKSTPTSVETGAQTEEETWSTTLGTSHSLTQRLQLAGSVSVNERYTDVAPMTRTWSGQTSLAWRISDRLNAGFGPTLSYNEVQNGPDTYSESYSAQLGWRPTDKLNLSLSGGRQYTHSRSASGLDLSSPIASLSIGYSPLPTTSLSLAVSQSVAPTYQGNQVNENYRWNAGLQQRLFGKLYLSLGYSRYNNDYAGTDLFGATTRRDLVESLSARLSTKLLKQISVSINVQQSKNTSNLAAFSFSSAQYGAELGWSF